MATKKKAPESAPATDNTDELVRAFAQRLSGSLAASEVKKGWSFSDEMDLLWSAGWPNMVLVDDSASALESDPINAQALFQGALWDGSNRFSRAAMWGYHRVLRDGAWAAQGKLSDASLALFADATPWSDKELRAFIAERTHPNRADGSTGRLVPWAIASLSSAELVADTMITAAEQWSDNDLNGWGVASCAMLHQLGFVLRWLAPAEHARAIARLTALRDRAQQLWPFAPHELDTVRELGWHFATLDLIVDGDRGAHNRGYQFEGKPQAFGLDFVATHSLVADAVSGFATGKHAGIHARALWLGGEPALRWYCSHWKKFTGDNEHARFVRVLGEVRSPLVTECMLAMTAESKAKKLARQWFDRRSDFARETLPALTSGPHGALATKLLAELG